MTFVRGFAQFWWDFIVGEDWRIAAGVGIVLTVGAFAVSTTNLSDTAITLLAGGSIVVLVSLSIAAPALRRGRQGS